MSIWVALEGCGYDEDGVPDEPWVNLANYNALYVFRMIGIPVEDETDNRGTLEVSELPEVVRSCIRIINLASSRKPYHRSKEEGVGARGCEYILPGIGDDYLIDRTKRLLKVFRKAQKEGARVVWW